MSELDESGAVVRKFQSTPGEQLTPAEVAKNKAIQDLADAEAAAKLAEVNEALGGADDGTYHGTGAIPEVRVAKDMPQLFNGLWTDWVKDKILPFVVPYVQAVDSATSSNPNRPRAPWEGAYIDGKYNPGYDEWIEYWETVKRNNPNGSSSLTWREADKHIRDAKDYRARLESEGGSERFTDEQWRASDRSKAMSDIVALSPLALVPGSWWNKLGMGVVGTVGAVTRSQTQAAERESADTLKDISEGINTMNDQLGTGSAKTDGSDSGGNNPIPPAVAEGVATGTSSGITREMFEAAIDQAKAEAEAGFAEWLKTNLPSLIPETPTLPEIVIPPWPEIPNPNVPDSLSIGLKPSGGQGGGASFARSTTRHSQGKRRKRKHNVKGAKKVVSPTLSRTERDKITAAPGSLNQTTGGGKHVTDIKERKTK